MLSAFTLAVSLVVLPIQHKFDVVPPPVVVALTSGIVEATPETFKTLTSTGIVIVDFYAPWCGWCAVEEKVLKSINKEYPDVKVVRFDADKYPLQKVQVFPTVVVIVNGKIIKSYNGAVSREDLLEVLKPHLPKGT